MASRFWVGGTGTWDNSITTNWSATSGGAGGQSVPAAADTVTFDASSGGGTVTVAATINASNTLASITGGAFTGTLDFSANNPSITLTTIFSFSGTGTRTLNLGSGTFTLSATTGFLWDLTTTTNLTFSGASATIVASSTAPTASRSVSAGSKTYGTLTIAAVATSSQAPGFNILGSNNFTAMNVGAGNWLNFSNFGTTTITNAFSWLGTASNAAILLTAGSSNGPTHTISSANNGTMAWTVLTGMLFSGGGIFTATNSFDLKGNTGVTITGPSGSASARMIGG